MPFGEPVSQASSPPAIKVSEAEEEDEVAAADGVALAAMSYRS
jgi:hypothetical protein